MDKNRRTSGGGQKDRGAEGDFALPRSYGMTLQAVRQGKGLKTAEFDKLLEETQSPFNNEGMKERKGKYGSRVTGWERAETNPSFSVQHRYALNSDTVVGILYLASHFYAQIRDYNMDGNTKHLDDARELADRIEQFAVRAREIVNNYPDRPDKLEGADNIHDGRWWQRQKMRASHIDKIIIPLLDGYRN